ncbi:MAG: DUF2905 family protein [candidate division WOR-3 bacterium]
MGKFLIYIGLVLVGLGLLLYLFETTSFKIPGDIVIKKPGITIFIPIGTSILISVLLTLLLNFIFRVRK